ncbi:uncharacterized protein LOC21394299 [Morus notabilis]|nr:uncharacterized protein LOC21394299 [Morus notabilis]
MEGKGGAENQERGSSSDESELSISFSDNSSKSSDITSDETGETDHGDPFGDLYCQYNETISPYDRIPLTEKIKELANEYPGLMKFQSTDLSPYSWIAIAWYPIYQIPLTKNVKELSACFLTFHHLSSFKEEQSKMFPFINCVEKEHTGGVCRDHEEKSEIAVPPFAALTYKMNGELWMNPATSDQEKIASYLDAASSWLKLLDFNHHDFNFFISRRRF